METAEELQLTEDEMAVYNALPGPPAAGGARVNRIVIIEWLLDDDRKTGTELHEWLESRRPGWSMLVTCSSAEDFAQCFAVLTEVTRTTGTIPLVHIEAHASEEGIEGPDGPGRIGQIPWEVMAVPLRALNEATRCNLAVFVATCIGYAVVKALNEGPRAPAIAVVGPGASVLPGDLLRASKEFYRRFDDAGAELHAMAASSSREAGTVDFFVEPFAVLAYDAMWVVIIQTLRNPKLDRAAVASLYQRTWDELFMIDVVEENRRRFGIDVRAAVDQVDAALRPQHPGAATS